MHSFITVFGRQIPLYGLFMFAGFFLGAAVNIPFQDKSKINRFDGFMCFIFGGIGGGAGAKLLYLIINARRIASYISKNGFSYDFFNSIMRGGFIFYGGIIGAFAAVLIYCRYYKINILHTLNTLVISIPFIHAFGRVGCFFAGCCYGIPYTGLCAVTYPLSSVHPDGISRFPVQLLEAGLLFLLFIILTLAFIISAGKKQESPGLALYLCGYAVIRFCTEFLRGDTYRGIFAGLSLSQWIAIAAFTVGSAILVSSVFRRRKTVQA